MTVPTQERLSAQEKYDRDGYVIFRNVIDPQLVAEANDHVAWLQRRQPDVRPEQLGHLYVKDDPFWLRLVGDDRLLVLLNTDVENVLGVEIPIEDVDESRAVDVVLAPGDVEVHHPTIVHGSNANTSPHRRCGLTIRYIPTSTRITGDEQPFPSAFLLRGEPGANVYQPRPRYVAGEHLPFRGSASWA